MTAPDQHILALISAVASSLDFAPGHPFSNGLFNSVLSLVVERKELLRGLKDSSLDAADLGRIWELITVDFPSYRRSLRAAYIKMVEETYRRANIPLPIDEGIIIINF